MIGAEAFTVGRDVFMSSWASDSALSHELSHVHDGESTVRPVIRRRGVRAQLDRGFKRFEEFKQSTQETIDLYEETGSDTYSLYKPEAQGVDPLHYTAGKVSTGQRTRFGNQPWFLRRATNLANWADGAVEGAERLYDELRRASEIADPGQGTYKNVVMPGDTVRFPDAESLVQNKWAAVAGKRVSSPQLGAVDKHFAVAVDQLEKRDRTSGKRPFELWYAAIHIANADNTWPFTPGAFQKKVVKGWKPSKADIETAVTDRANKCKPMSTRDITLKVILTHPLLSAYGEINVDL